MSQHCIDDDDRFTYYHCYYHFQHYCFILLFYVLIIIISIMFQHHRWGAVNRCRHSREPVRNRFQQPMHFCNSIKKSFLICIFVFLLTFQFNIPTDQQVQQAFCKLAVWLSSQNIVLFFISHKIYVNYFTVSPFKEIFQSRLFNLSIPSKDV